MPLVARWAEMGVPSDLREGGAFRDVVSLLAAYFPRRYLRYRANLASSLFDSWACTAAITAAIAPRAKSAIFT